MNSVRSRALDNWLRPRVGLARAGGAALLAATKNACVHDLSFAAIRGCVAVDYGHCREFGDNLVL